MSPLEKLNLAFPAPTGAPGSARPVPAILPDAPSFSTRKRRTGRAVTLALLAFGGLAWRANPVQAQAFASETGELGVSLNSAFQFSDAVYYGEFGKITGLSTQSLRTSLGVEFTPLERLTFGAELTGQMDRYSGPQTGANPDIIVAHGEQDDGDWHRSLSDLDLDVRYQLLDGAIALSPLVHAKIPLTDYEVKGYAVPGTGLLEIGGGLYIGKIGLFTERLFAEAGYTYTWVQKEDVGGEATEEFSVNHSDVMGQLGYFFGDSLAVSLGGEYRLTHGGVELDELRMQVPVVQEFHDPLLSRRFFAATAAANYSATDSVSVGLALAAVLWGDNVSDAKTLALTLSWANQVL